MREVVWSGDAISADGVYADVPMDVYHKDLCVAPSVSSSGLRTIALRSPLHFFDNSYLNLEREPEDKPHFVLGRAVHSLLLSEGGFNDDYVVRPAQWKDWRKGEAQEWRGAMLAEGKSILTPENLEQIRGMARAVAAEPEVATLLRGRIERTLIYRHETGVFVKVRPDVIQPEDNASWDLKTTTDASDRAVGNTIRSYGYDQQIALTLECFMRFTDNDPETFFGGDIFVETKRPFAINVKPIDVDDLWRARRVNEWAIRRFAACVEAWDWPAYPDSFEPWRAPEYLRRARDENPELPNPPVPERMNEELA